MEQLSCLAYTKSFEHTLVQASHWVQAGPQPGFYCEGAYRDAQRMGHTKFHSRMAVYSTAEKLSSLKQPAASEVSMFLNVYSAPLPQFLIFYESHNFSGRGPAPVDPPGYVPGFIYIYIWQFSDFILFVSTWSSYIICKRLIRDGVCQSEERFTVYTVYRDMVSRGFTVSLPCTPADGPASACLHQLLCQPGQTARSHRYSQVGFISKMRFEFNLF